MPFSERIKEETRYKSRSCCVICKKFFRSCEVHHIIPESEGGTNEIDNAVLLCRNHHSEFGHKPEFIEKIRADRKIWYDYCKIYMPDGNKINERFEKIEKTVETLEKKQKTPSIDVTQDTLVKGIDVLISDLQSVKILLKKKDVTPADISTASLYLSGQSVDADSLGSYGLSSVDKNVKSSATYSPYSGLAECPTCGNLFTPDHEVCPYCGQFYND